MKEIEAEVQLILTAITQRYVMTDSKIPPDILAFKDDVMEIYSKAKQETDPGKLRQYALRLAEMRESVIPDD